MIMDISAKMDIGGVTRFSADLSASAHDDLPDVVRGVGKPLLIKIVGRMPVLTGRARAGWKAAGSALDVDVPDADSGAEMAGDSGYEEVWEGQRFTITMINRVPYVVFLEYGSSAKAPLGMVRISILEMQHELGTDLGANLKEHWSALGQADRFAQHAIEFQKLAA